MTVGVLGGTFNPIHIGHLILAQEVGAHLKFSKVLFVPSKIPPHKTSAISEIDRYQMVKLAIADNSFFEISPIEINRCEISYTVRTIQLLKLQQKASLAFIVGSDNIAHIPQWHKWRELLSTCELAVGERPGFAMNKQRKQTAFNEKFWRQICKNIVSIPGINVSSSQIRKRYANGQSTKYLVPESVDRYIIENKLYQFV